ncbi:MAG: universal stress protein [Actinomycetota bacterium]|nr:universal stress protein [Actinomycetota bacterium]
MNVTANRRWLVGVDGSDESLDALAWARDAASSDERIVVVHAWDVPVVVGYDVAVAIDPRSIEDAAQAFLDDLIARTDDDRVTGRLIRSHAGRGIVDLTEGDDVVVLGHRGTGRMSMMLGSTASYVLHHVARPVVIVRGDGSHPIRKVVVGADDHDLVDDEGALVPGAENEAVRALRWAVNLPGVAEVTVTHAWFLPAVVAGWYAGPGADFEVMDAASDAVIDHVIAAAGPIPEGVAVGREVLRGTPGFALIEASRDADLVTVGSRGRGTLRGLLLGSTSAEVASYGHCPVAVVR